MKTILFISIMFFLAVNPSILISQEESLGNEKPFIGTIAAAVIGGHQGKAVSTAYNPSLEGKSKTPLTASIQSMKERWQITINNPSEENKVSASFVFIQYDKEGRVLKKNYFSKFLNAGATTVNFLRKHPRSVQVELTVTRSKIIKPEKSQEKLKEEDQKPKELGKTQQKKSPPKARFED